MPKMIEITHADPTVRAFMLFMQISQAAYKYSDRYFYFNGRTSTPVFTALDGLIRSGGTMTHTELAKWTNTVKHNISALVDRMKKDGLVTTEASKQDLRISYVQITEKGRAAFDKAVPASREIMERVTHGMGKEGAAELEKLLKIMKKNLERESSQG